MSTRARWRWHKTNSLPSLGQSRVQLLNKLDEGESKDGITSKLVTPEHDTVNRERSKLPTA